MVKLILSLIFRISCLFIRPKLLLMVVLKVVAVAARQLDRAKTFAENHKIPKFYGSYEELAKDGNVGKSATRFSMLN